jgi:hypothetical protein
MPQADFNYSLFDGILQISHLNVLNLFFIRSYYTSTIFPGVNSQPRAAKRQRLMTPPQTRSNGILASPQIVIQSPQNTQQQQLTANKLTAAANSILQLQHQQQLLLAAMPVPVTNSVQCQNPVNGDAEGPPPTTVDQFKIYSEFSNSCSCVS